MNVCSTFLTEEAGYYNKLTNSYSNVWHTFVPSQDNMTSSNCWYAKNFNFLPQRLFRKLMDVTTFADIESQFEKSEVRNILSGIFKITNRTLFTFAHTGHHFCLPRTFLIGFPKCGTTFLYKYIEEHPLMARPHGKEGQFWREFVNTKDINYRELMVLLYLFHFHGASQSIKLHPEMFTVDASASTVFATHQPFKNEKDACVVPAIMSSTLPNSKFIIIVRNPIDRLWSDFWYFCSRSEWTSNNFKIKVPDNVLPIASEIFHNYTVLAIQEYVNCVSKNNSQLFCATLVGSVSGEDAGCHRVRLGLSMYYIHILRWLSVIPQHQILLLRLEDLIENATEGMNKIWSFLNVPNVNTVKKSKQNSNKWITEGKYSAHFTMLEKTRHLLKDFFHPYNLKLAEYTNDQRYLWNEE